MGVRRPAIKGTWEMKVRDFGTFDDPLLLCGGPYSNLQALQALAEIADGNPCVCTGDVVAYGAAPSETIALMRTLGWPVVAGNCERQIAEAAPDCGCGFGIEGTCDRLAQSWYPYALSGCDDEARAWMADLPDIGTFQQGSRRYAVIHGGATTINRYLWPSSAAEDLQSEIEAIEAHIGKIDGVVAGHSGIAFQRRINGRHWINAGAVGLPPHDGRPETRYAILDNGEVVFHRLHYDHSAAKTEMERVGLTQGYHIALSTGVWPSEDILPPELTR
jgi:predicted phosphodiesterase